MDGGAKLDIEPTQNPKLQKFTSPDPFVETNFASVIKAKLAISEYLNVPLAKLDKSEMLLIEKVLEKTLNKSEIFNHIDGLNLTTVGGDKDVNRCDGIL